MFKVMIVSDIKEEGEDVFDCFIVKKANVMRTAPDVDSPFAIYTLYGTDEQGNRTVLRELDQNVVTVTVDEEPVLPALKISDFYDLDVEGVSYITYRNGTKFQDDLLVNLALERDGQIVMEMSIQYQTFVEILNSPNVDKCIRELFKYPLMDEIKIEKAICADGIVLAAVCQSDSTVKFTQSFLL